MIHSTAIIDPTANVAADVEIGPYSVIGPNVEIDSGCKISPHVVINGPTKIGKNNRIFQFASIGEEPQDKKFQGETTYLHIGDNNIFREFVTVHRGTENGGGETRIGNDNLFMAYVHIAHDCIVHDETVFANNASLAGHVIIKNYAIISGFSAVRQYTVVGEHSFVAGETLVVKDVLPYTLVSGLPAEPCGLNSVGLKRRGFSEDVIASIKRAYKVIYRQGLTVANALEELHKMVVDVPELQIMIDSLRSAERGITR